ncbi:hypothetical protein FIBSPDRAFT_894642 [Athelia psychrophila]|uniref:Uncharacterized protein n=1 Tax=Athelia psychrophila TaxID=1759441 RepID=A0A166FJL4_9AGAM|nr:hypothetical protein FIBSPDRAFT_894642 [Fibularhizoctonia sp. CBS 109695]
MGQRLLPPVATPLFPTLAPDPAPGRYKFQDDRGHIASKDLDSLQVDATRTLQTNEYPGDLGPGGVGEGLAAGRARVDYATEKRTDEKGMHADTRASEGGEGEVREWKLLAITKHLTGHAGDTPGWRGRGGLQPAHRAPPFPIAMPVVNRKPEGPINYTDTDNPQDKAWVEAM